MIQLNLGAENEIPRKNSNTTWNSTFYLDTGTVVLTPGLLGTSSRSFTFHVSRFTVIPGATHGTPNIFRTFGLLKKTTILLSVN